MLPPRTFHTLHSCRIFKFPVCYVVYTHEYLHMFWEDLGTSWTIKTEDEGARTLRNSSNYLQPTRRRRNTPQDLCLRFPSCHCPSQIRNVEVKLYVLHRAMQEFLDPRSLNPRYLMEVSGKLHFQAPLVPGIHLIGGCVGLK